MHAALRIGCWSRWHTAVALALCLLAVPSVAPAATYSWDLGSGGSLLWSNAANWNPDGNPGSGDNVIIGAIAYYCLLDVNTTVTNLTFQGTFVNLLGTGGSNNLTVNGTFAWSDGSTVGTNSGATVGTTTLNGTTTISAGAVLGRNIVNNATANITGGSALSRQSGISTSSWTNNSGGTLLKTTDNSGTSTVAWDVVNNGTVRANAGTLSFTGAFSQGSGGNTGASSGATVNLGGPGAGRPVQGRLWGYGTITANSGINHSNGTITPGGGSAGTLTIGTNLTLDGTSIFQERLGAAGAGADDKLVVNGNLKLPSSSTPVTVNIVGNATDMFARDGELVPIINYTGTLTGNASSFAIGTVPDGTLKSLFWIVIDEATYGKNVMLRVPEPSTVALGISLSLMGLVFAWRKRKAAR